MRIPLYRAAAAVLAAGALTLPLTACDADAPFAVAGDTSTGAEQSAPNPDVPSLNSLVDDLVGNLDGASDSDGDGIIPDALQGSDDTPPAVEDPAVDSAAYPAVDPVAIRAALDSIEVKGRAPKTGYARDQFGQAWADVDRNGCDTRNDILARDLTDITFKDGTCRVLTGTLDDPYTGQMIHFVRGQDTSTAVQIDHLVALSDAWQKGAQQLSPERREQLANDPVNLLAADGPANSQKSDGDAATWLPANKAYRCTYVSKQVEVKSIYGLWVTQAEKDAINRVLDTCGA